MQIETYEIEEINSSEASQMAADSEAVRLCDELGLVGQLSLCNKETDTRFQYPRLTTQQEVILTALFPEKTAVKQFKDGIIPVRVLQVIAHCQQFSQTKCLTIWHSDSPKEDPVLIGAQSEYSSEKYLLARWGDSLLTWDEMLGKALPIVKSELAVEFNDMADKFKGWVSKLDVIAEKYVRTGKKPHWHVYD